MKHEANRKEPCDFTVMFKGEQWEIDMAWISLDGTVAWYDGRTYREGISFHRIFTPDEIVVPPIEQDIPKGEG